MSGKKIISTTVDASRDKLKTELLKSYKVCYIEIFIKNWLFFLNWRLPYNKSLQIHPQLARMFDENRGWNFSFFYK